MSAGHGTYGGFASTTSKDAFAGNASIDPRNAVIRCPFNQAFNRADNTARLDTSMATTCLAPNIDAVIASAPVPVQMLQHAGSRRNPRRRGRPPPAARCPTAAGTRRASGTAAAPARERAAPRRWSPLRNNPS
ncbi:hypothetical protein GCM10018954_084860 [Kutzneria kofuensis]